MMRTRSVLMMLPVIGLSAVGFRAVGAETVAMMKVEVENCTTDASLENTKTKKQYPESYGHIGFLGHLVTWKDGAKTYSIVLDEETVLGHQFPELIQKETTVASKEGVNPVLSEKSTRSFTSDANYVTKLTTSSIDQSTLQKSATESVISDVTPGSAPKQPEYDSVSVDQTTPIVKSDLILISLGPIPANGGLQILSSKTVCEYTPSAMADLKFSGFFSKAKAHLLAFDSKNTVAVAAEKALAACQATADADCAALEKSAEAALAARETLWASLFKTSDLKAPRPPVVHSGGGYSGGGGYSDGGGYYGGDDGDDSGSGSVDTGSGGGGGGNGWHGGGFDGGHHDGGFGGGGHHEDGGGHPGGGFGGGGNHDGGGNHGGGGGHEGPPPGGGGNHDGGGHPGGGDGGGHGGGDGGGHGGGGGGGHPGGGDGGGHPGGGGDGGGHGGGGGHH